MYTIEHVYELLWTYNNTNTIHYIANIQLQHHYSNAVITLFNLICGYYSIEETITATSRLFII